MEAQEKEEFDIWNRQHEVCPQCGSENIICTQLGPPHIVGQGYRDDINTAACQVCVWGGMVNQLVPKRK